MKPLILELESFGPFGKKETIDFRELDGHQLFLISGRTGAGKSSLLDGICFALYGKTSGGERDSKNMKSHFTDPDLRPRVSFTFGIKNKVFKVERQAALEFVNDKGKKAKKLHKAYLCEMEGADLRPNTEKELTRTSEVDEKIHNILGLTHEQFRQIVVLPQGKFREFLKADSKTKEKTLEKLFNTSKYKRIENKIHESFREAYGELRNLEARYDELIREKEYKNSKEVNELIVKADLIIKETIKKIDKTDLEVKKSADQFQKAKVLKESFDNFNEIQDKLREKTSKFPIVEQKRSELRKSKDAQTLLPDFKIITNLRQEIETNENQLNSSKKKELLLRENLQQLKNQEIELLKEEKLFEKEKLFLNQGKEKLNKLKLKCLLVNEIEELKKGCSFQSRKLQDLEGELEKLKNEKKNLKEKIDSLPSLVEKIHLLKGNLKLQGERLALILKKEETKKRISLEEEKKNLKEKEISQIESDLKRLQKEKREKDQEKLTLQLSHLSSELKHGKPCLVCGSVEHPSPFKKVEDIQYDFSEEESVEEKIELEQTHLLKEKEIFQKHSVTLDHLKKENQELTKTLDLDEAINEDILKKEISKKKEEEKNLNTKWSEVKSNKVNVEKIEQQLTFKSNEIEKYRSLYQKELLGLKSKENQLQNLKEYLVDIFEFSSEEFEKVLAEKEKWCASYLQNKSNLDIRLRKTEEELNLEIGGMNNLALLIEKSIERKSTLKEKFLLDLNQFNLKDEKEFREFIKDPSYLKELEARIQKFQEELKELQSAELKIKKDIEGKYTPNLELLSEEHEKKREMRDNLFQEKARLEEEKKFKSLEYARLYELEKRIEDSLSQVTVLKELDQTASGKNSYMIGLQRFVLTTWLDEVLVAGSHRLKLMSQGRYELKRAKTVKDYRSQAGLDLVVIDSYTGQERDVSTLSGGEGFLASLSLALGLSDIVQAYSGGIQLDTLFIDEGFGTLDQEALDLAYKTLTDIKGSGRLVGIISHVSELKEWIPARLEVESNMNGSKTKFIV